MDIPVESVFQHRLMKQARELTLPQKSEKLGQPIIYLNNASVAHINCQKHLGMFPNEKQNFHQHII